MQHPDLSMWRRGEEAGCPHFESCDAPLCPLDAQLEQRVWFPDEPACALRKTSQEPEWMYTQRKIALAAGESRTYFVPAMLRRKTPIRHGISGICPDRASRKDQLRRWKTKHPEEERVEGPVKLRRLEIRLSGRTGRKKRLPVWSGEVRIQRPEQNAGQAARPASGADGGDRADEE